MLLSQPGPHGHHLLRPDCHHRVPLLAIIRGCLCFVWSKSATIEAKGNTICNLSYTVLVNLLRIHLFSICTPTRTAV